jgi:hypothetical protein
MSTNRQVVDLSAADNESAVLHGVTMRNTEGTSPGGSMAVRGNRKSE